MTKVCMLTTGFPRFPGDLFGTFVFELARELASGGAEVVVLAPHEAGRPRRERFGAVEIRRFRYFWPAAAQKVAYGGGIPSNLRSSWIARLQVPFFLLGFCWGALWCTRRADLVHCHWTISGLVAHIATRLWRKPLVLSVRGSDIHLVEKGLMARLNRRIYAWVDLVVAVSEDIGRKLADAGVPERKIEVVANGVDGRFKPGDREAARRQLGLPERDFIALSVGLLVPVKGLDVLIEGMAQVEGPRPLLALVGDGPQRPELEALAAERGLADRMHWAGRQSSEVIPVWMAAADMLVLPSRSEGRPNVVLEAQACGLPVVATAVGGVAELVRDGETGLLVASEDPSGLARAIGRVRDDEALRGRLCAAGREQAAGMTWTASAERMAGLYRRALGAA